jgi:hypothetical protein
MFVHLGDGNPVLYGYAALGFRYTRHEDRKYSPEFLPFATCVTSGSLSAADLGGIPTRLVMSIRLAGLPTLSTASSSLDNEDLAAYPSCPKGENRLEFEAVSVFIALSPLTVVA